MIKFANHTKLFKAMKRTNEEVCFHEACDYSVNFTVGDVVNAESLHGREMANKNAGSCRNMSTK